MQPRAYLVRKKPVTQTASLVTSKYDCCCIYLHTLVHCSSACSDVNDQRFSVGISHVSVFHFSSFPTVSRNSHFFLMVKKQIKKEKVRMMITPFFQSPLIWDIMYADIIRVVTHKKVKNSLTFHWLLNSFHWPFINEKQSMFTFALAFLQAIDIFLFIFNHFSFSWKEEEGIWKKAITTKTTDHNYYMC